MRAADEATKIIAEEFDHRDEAVMKGAIRSAHVQQVAVPFAIVVTGIMTLWFVIAAQRRLTAKLEADRKIAEGEFASPECARQLFGWHHGGGRRGCHRLREPLGRGSIAHRRA